MAKPRYDLVDALTVAAHNTYHALDARYNPDVVLWEVLEVNRYKNVGGFIVGLIDELSYQEYLEIREKIAADN